LISLDGVAPSQMVGVYASVIAPQGSEDFFWHWLTRVVSEKGT